jgi:hypothetical protein
VFRPDPVLAAGFLGGGLAVLYGVATGQAIFGALVAAVVAAPPALFHARYGESINPLAPGATLVVGCWRRSPSWSLARGRTCW